MADTISTMVTTYWDRLKPEIDERGWGISQLASAMGVSYQAIVKIRDGGAFGSANNIKAAAIFGLDPTWLATGKGTRNAAPPRAPEPSNVSDAPALIASRRVPVVGHAKGGVDGFLEEMQFPVGHGEGFVEYWTRDPEAYALRVRGDSMSPRYRAREFIVVTPSVEAQPGNDVMVKLRDGRKMLKHLNWVRDDEIQLISVNDGYEPMTLLREEIESIQRVAGGVPADAFQENRED